MGVLFSAAHYSDRAAMPPSLGVFNDMYTPPLATDPEVRDLQRHIYALFPLTSLAAALNVTVLEGSYIEYVSSTLSSSSTHSIGR